MLSTLIDDALEYQKNRSGRIRDYMSKAKIVKEALGGRSASAITPQELDSWLSSSTRDTSNVQPLPRISEHGLQAGDAQ